MIRISEENGSKEADSDLTQAVFSSFVNAYIPRTEDLAYEYGSIQYYGALDSYTNEYLIMSLNNNVIPLADATAKMMNDTAILLFSRQAGNQNNKSPDNQSFADYAMLAPYNQFLVNSIINNLNIDLNQLPEPFTNNPPFIFSIMGSINRDTLMGYYSEWSGYGSTRLSSPNNRKLEYFPIGWSQAGYPGPSLGYRALREYHFS